MFPMGGVIWFAHLTVCDVHSFLRSTEHDLFALLFLSDLIGHYPLHISDRCKCTRGISKLNIIPQRPKIQTFRPYGVIWNAACCPWLVWYFQTLSAKCSTQNHKLTVRQQSRPQKTNFLSSLHLFSASFWWRHLYHDDVLPSELSFCPHRNKWYNFGVHLWRLWCRSNLHFYCASCENVVWSAIYSAISAAP